MSLTCSVICTLATKSNRLLYDDAFISEEAFIPKILSQNLYYFLHEVCGEARLQGQQAIFWLSFGNPQLSDCCLF